MYKAIIRCIGKPTDVWHQQAIHSYQERLAPFVHLETVELPEGHKGSAKPDEAKTRSTEAQSLLKGIPKDLHTGILLT